MGNNKLIIAAAGSGKTTYLVDEALKIVDGDVLITTYTDANETEIRHRIIEKNKFIPGNIKVQTWFSFLLQHGVRPYQGCRFEPDIKGMILVNEQSGLKFKTKRGPIYYGEDTEFERHYFNSKRKIYSDKIAKFVIRCNEASGGAVIGRLCKIYSYIFIDEVQDLAGYDLEILKLVFDSKISTLLVGDPRQAVYSTNNLAKNKKFKKGDIVHFFEDSSINIDRDDKLLTVNYRSISSICDLSNKLFPQFPQVTSGNSHSTGHDGIFLVRSKDVAQYLLQYAPIQLRDSIRKVVDDDRPVLNFGKSKGRSFCRVLIYPTEPIVKWLKDNASELAPISRSKLYVAITRARYSVAFVYDYKDGENLSGAKKYVPT